MVDADGQDLIRQIAEAVKDVGLREKFRVVIGGTGTSAEYARLIGADGWGKDSVDALGLCQRLMGSVGGNLESNGGGQNET